MVISCQKNTKISEYEKQKRRKKISRIFQRLSTGLQIARNKRQEMRFLTLTSPIRKKRPIKKSFDILRKRIKRATMFEKDNITIKDGFYGFNFNKYFCLRTKEGNGVLHIIYWGHYIPKNWLISNWLDIHGAFQVKINIITRTRNSIRKLTNYLLTNYLLKQPIDRMSYGWGWAWLGFAKSWQKMRETYSQLRRTDVKAKFGSKLKSIQEITCYFKNTRANHTISAWLCILHNPPVTSYQLKIDSKRWTS